jgi:hypothetical protein
MSVSRTWGREILSRGGTLLLATTLSLAQTTGTSPQSGATPATQNPAPKAGTAETKPVAKTDSAASKTQPTAHKGKRSKRRASWRNRQKKIDTARVREIQEALIREHYLHGEPSGKWDLATQKALERYQAENGWQSKVVPDSRALIKLGLGPNHDHLLNPESAMTNPVPPVNGAAHPVVPPDSSHASGEPQTPNPPQR